MRASFVGRDRDLARLERLFAAGIRLVTVRGPAGVGKTRFALQAARERIDAGQLGGVWFCDLTETRSARDVCAEVARALEVPLPRSDDEDRVVTQLGRALAARGPSLLVLDNLEQVIADAARVLSRWLEVAGEVRVLVTSRESLSLLEEQLLDLAPLAVPPEGESEPERIAHFDAVRLFVERARAAMPDFDPPGEDLPLLAEIVRRLDGFPLAIELAAPYVEILAPAELADRLARRFEVLAGGRRDGERRQQTMWAAIDWSWQLLSGWERSALAQCSVFRGGFSLEAAEEVLDLADDPEAPPVVRALRALRDKSLVHPAGDGRFGLYESIREYAQQKLGARAEETRARHAEHFLTVGARWASELRGPHAAASLARLRLEEDNLRAALAWSLGDLPAGPSAARVGQALEAALCLSALLSTAGSLADACHVLSRALEAAARAGADPRLVARARRARGASLRRRGHLEESLEECRLALERARESRSPEIEGSVLCEMARVQAAGGRAGSAKETLERSLELARRIGSRHLEAEALTHRAILERQEGDHRRAFDRLQRALVVTREAGDRELESRVLGNLCAAAIELEMDDRLPGLVERARAAFDSLGNRRSRALLGAYLGVYLAGKQRFGEARQALEESYRTFRDLGDRAHEGRLLRTLGWLAQVADGPERGLEEFEAAMPLLEAEDGGPNLFALTGRAVALAAGDRVEEARVAFSAAGAARASSRDPTARFVSDVCLGHLKLALARAAEREGDLKAARALAEEAKRIRERGRADERSSERRHIAARLAAASALFLLSRALSTRIPVCAAEHPRSGGTGEAPGDSPPPDALVVGDAGAWFRPPGGGVVVLARRKPMRCILRKLVEERIRAPGRPLGVDVLVEAGWPGEQILRSAGASRVHVAIGDLRKLGLRGLLLREEQGYFLDPTVPLIDGYRRKTVLEPEVRRP